MTRMASLVLLAAIIGASVAVAAETPVYVLKGYSFEGKFGGANTAELATKLKDHPGARITKADIAVDVELLARALKARHITGRLFTGTAEKHGRIWVIFNLVDLSPPGENLWMGRHLSSQHFEGVSGVPTSALVNATGLKTGDALTMDKLIAARNGITALYAKSRPGEKFTLRFRIQTGPNYTEMLSWVIVARK